MYQKMFILPHVITTSKETSDDVKKEVSECY